MAKTWYDQHLLPQTLLTMRVNRRLADVGLPPLTDSSVRSMRTRKQHGFPEPDGHLDRAPYDEAGRALWLASTVDAWVKRYILSAHGDRLLDLAQERAASSSDDAE